MGIYETLVTAYDELFPPAPAAQAFFGYARPKRAGRPALAIDLGCATGAHVALLAGTGWSALGVDPSAAMIAAANERHGDLAGIRFATGSMQDVDGLAPPGSASMILCVGNTLPHLGRSELGGFFSRSAETLEPEGRLVVQMLNYAKLLAERPASLPDIRAGSWLFRRSYRYGDDGSVVFATELSETGGAENPERGETVLTPFTVDEALAAAGAAGFSALGVYASWNRDRFDPAASTVALIDLRLGP
ncbi:MAG: hypothetical protein CVV47_13430 [Spirochaetae bacterium HGW-Spirochaetae-3]|jgi:SAM-dependent methyltransferase|nr:MAG: hypothetical protein CVV47_13430 [Spirochaetae bacterium HGW-Spirochaetae-3]